MSYDDSLHLICRELTLASQEMEHISKALKARALGTLGEEVMRLSGVTHTLGLQMAEHAAHFQAALACTDASALEDAYCSAVVVQGASRFHLTHYRHLIKQILKPC